MSNRCFDRDFHASIRRDLARRSEAALWRLLPRRVMNLHSYRGLIAFGTFICMTLLFLPALFGQNNVYYDRTKAVPEDRSRAEQEAERLVSLSAEKIISILSQEPGLLLECKKLLVREAFKQGRTLDPQDLTDDALYRLVRLDQYVRILLTREIEDRDYVHAKPSREELERDQQQGRVRMPDSAASLQGGGFGEAKSSKSQEDSYWSRHERGSGNASPGFSLPTPQSPQQTQPSSPSVDPRRALLQAQAQSGNTPDLAALQSVGLSSMSPD